MKKTLFLTAFTFIGWLPLVANATNYKLKDSKVEVLEQAERYAQSVACSTTFNSESENTMNSIDYVYPISYINDENLGTTSEFLVLWGGDRGCLGGSGTYSFYLTEFQRVSESRPFTVIIDDLFLLEDFNPVNPRFIKDVSYNGKTKNLEVISYDFAPKDSNCCPSLKYRYVFNNDDTGWKFINKYRLN